MTRCGLAFGALVASLLGPGCSADSTYDKLAKEFLAKGPVACCEIEHGAVTGECRLEAEKKCAFLRGGTFTTKSITERGNAARTLAIDVSGPNGNGRCLVYMHERASGNRKRGIVAHSAKCDAL